jgi:hypothetical protein
MCIKLVIEKLIDIMMHGQRNIKKCSIVFDSSISFAFNFESQSYGQYCLVFSYQGRVLKNM